MTLPATVLSSQLPTRRLPVQGMAGSRREVPAVHAAAAPRAVPLFAKHKRQGWVNVLAERHALIERAMSSGALDEHGAALAKPGRTAAQRNSQIARIAKLIAPGAWLVSSSLKPPVHAVFAFLHARESAAENPKEPTDEQSIVDLNYLVIGNLSTSSSSSVSSTLPNSRDLLALLSGRDRLSTGLWSFEISEHAVGRFFEYYPSGDLVAVLGAAHRDLLALRVDQILPFLVDRDHRTAYLAAGPTVFVTLPFSLAGKLYFRVETVLPGDNLGPRRLQQVIHPDELAGERLADNLLRPVR